ncbi:MAG: recombination mediator RecR [Candidatus Marinimicrobia bacterium]|jgi:recombination protein RecR|nr:recombination mediator RecR [Candidatus Neomarinimicrobiota bacterium]
MSNIPDSIEKISELFSKFPGIGRKSARRIAFHLMDASRENVIEIAKAIIDLKDKVKHCPICNYMTEKTKCSICSDPKRDDSVICVVEDSMDVIALEKSVSFNGKYHVLGGLISPLDGIGPDDLDFDGLLKRLDNVKEIVVAINPSIEGDTTIYYLNKIVKNGSIKITNLARGIPIGGDLEFTDEATIARALENRTEIKRTDK